MAEENEIRKALLRSTNGQTARQLVSACDSFEDVNAMVKVIHGLKSAGKVRADGMRDSQVVYKLGDWPEMQDSPKPATNIPEIIPAQAVAVKAKHTASGLRDGLFEMLAALKSGKVDANVARSYAQLSMTILKSLEIQMQYAKMVNENDIPASLADIELVPQEK